MPYILYINYCFKVNNNKHGGDADLRQTLWCLLNKRVQR